MTEIKEIIGLDVGMKRTGIARASTTARLPEPLLTVETDKTLETVKKITVGRELEAIVVGLPRNLSGEDTEQTKWVRDWVKVAKDDIPTPFFWQDEALSTIVAKERFGSSKKNDIDAQSAAVILQDFLDTPADKRVLC